MSETINFPPLPQFSDGPCASCGRNPGTKIWSGEMGTMAAVRLGLDRMPRWCELCVAEAQLAHARERSAAIPELVKTIERLGGKVDCMPAEEELLLARSRIGRLEEAINGIYELAQGVRR